MQMQEYLRYHIIMMVSVGANESVLSFIDEVRRWALIFLDKLYATINMPALKELSRMFQNLLLHSKIQLLNEHLESSALLLSLIGCAIATTILWRMLWAGFRVEKTAFKIVDADAAKSARFSWGSVYGYFRSLVDWLLKGLILFCCVLIITTGLFIICKTLWFSYVASPVGRLYPVYFPQRARLMGMVLGQDIIVFPIMLTILSFGAGLICAAGCRFFYLTRYIFLARGLMGRILLLSLPINVLAAAALRPIFPYPHWGAAYAATLIPTLLSFIFCFKFTNRFLPEWGMLFRGLSRQDKTPARTLFLQNLNSVKTVLEFDPISGKRTGKQFPAYDGVQTQGQFLSRRGHEFILYRYGRDLFFLVDNLELPLHPDMSTRILEKGRWLRRFELSRDDTRLFRLNWSTLPMSGARRPTVRFFNIFKEILDDRETYETVFIIEEDEQDLAEDTPRGM
ncbi:uncharacterized protein Dvar_41980 [Desulfosarcina variabilis str. Montpellier]|uniref:hypothetical protein n=1 Tax=Desulfosarcina variabilis TaxID=2300 RepID=UPI003AFA0AE0